MTTTTLIVDASVGIKWLFEEEHNELAREILKDDYTRVVPDLFYSEVANAIWKRIRRKEIDVADGIAAMAALFRIPVFESKAKNLLPSALKIAADHDRTVYDSVYLALAVQRGARLVTADLKLYNALQGTSIGDIVVWIESLPL